ncbi:endo-1,3-beta-glucanase Eng1 [Schizosaccharomyces cryophilus OY26]|uniref:glucan endo-1,3-beta-D-glucosidase n=1 Tax=Schizosaccharomyces cryophilus (strain OY26 / ATCC MYA-4695 / CBS 11777 / NBRC 106824 / NRRL Y48691) TaxID=653667 RepID=S9VX02_SCHCR|nr:endo-1,3-beta-glucanase Eng1 [Schizosaccharomyces cryophilus OY26]EPY50774.1 endo-1,3-beta-glucanase Eng1 [Schizosaccharomyces cryophilus OY26]
MGFSSRSLAYFLVGCLQLVTASPLYDGPEVMEASSQKLEKRSTDVFNQVIDTSDPSTLFGSASHPLTPAGLSESGKPTETNKFYDNLLIGSRTSFLYADPYRYWWQSSITHSGICIAHTDENQRVFDWGSTVPNFYYNPIGLCSLAFGGSGLTNAIAPQVDEIDQLSARVNFNWGSSSMKISLVEGLAFTTAEYSNAVPEIFTSTFFMNAVVSASGSSATQKYKVTLSDGHIWLIYVFGDHLTLNANGNQVLVGSNSFNGYIQIAKIPFGDTKAESIYDQHAGSYVTGISVSGHVDGDTGYYTFNLKTSGDSSVTPLHFLLPHQIESLSSGASTTDISLVSLVSGYATAVAGSSITFADTVPKDIHFLPWSPEGKKVGYSTDALNMITTVADQEVNGDMAAESNLDSMYYSGKVLAKYAMLCLTVNDIVNNTQTSNTCVQKLESAMARFVDNKQINPLVYDSTWKGVVSKAGLSGYAMADFGNTYYNDHHFHYGYFVLTAAVIAHIDPNWLTVGNNKRFINSLIRDVSNPTSDDPYFPVQRMFDFYHGHSWAGGLFEANDGKDEESTSEDYNFFYGMKLWGEVTGDHAMVDRANIILSVLKRALNKYILYSDGNVQPKSMQPNYVAGITFMNKITHVTYFGMNPEYVEGIQMLPITPISAYIREQSFIRNEWNNMLINALATASPPWRTLLYADYAIAEPWTSYNYFATPAFQAGWLDIGASRAWYLAFSAGLDGRNAVYYPTDVYASDSDSSSSSSGSSSSSASVTTTTSQVHRTTSVTSSVSLPTDGIDTSSTAVTIISVSSFAPVPTSTSTSSLKICNKAVYDPSLYVCDDDVLCPIVNGVSYANCNGACYNPVHYGCYNNALGLPTGTSSYTISSSIRTSAPTAGTSSGTPSTDTNLSESPRPTSGMHTCGGTMYDASAIVCYKNDVLCPVIDGDVYQECNGSCYNSSKFTCKNGSVFHKNGSESSTASATTATSATPTSSSITATSPSATASSTPIIAQCGLAWYNSMSYVCYGNLLCPIVGNKPMQACGSACYDSDAYNCLGGRLVSN